MLKSNTCAINYHTSINWLYHCLCGCFVCVSSNIKRKPMHPYMHVICYRCIETQNQSIDSVSFCFRLDYSLWLWLIHSTEYNEFRLKKYCFQCLRLTTLSTGFKTTLLQPILRCAQPFSMQIWITIFRSYYHFHTYSVFQLHSSTSVHLCMQILHQPIQTQHWKWPKIILYIKLYLKHVISCKYVMGCRINAISQENPEALFPVFWLLLRLCVWK